MYVGSCTYVCEIYFVCFVFKIASLRYYLEKKKKPNSKSTRRHTSTTKAFIRTNTSIGGKCRQAGDKKGDHLIKEVVICTM